VLEPGAPIASSGDDGIGCLDIGIAQRQLLLLDHRGGLGIEVHPNNGVRTGSVGDGLAERSSVLEHPCCGVLEILADVALRNPMPVEIRLQV
jgi:hypothetical protein